MSNELKQVYAKGYRVSQDPHTAKIAVVVDALGNVKDVQLLSSGNLDVLDKEAVEIFKDLSPMPAPPTSLVKNDSAKIRWDFIIEN